MLAKFVPVAGSRQMEQDVRGRVRSQRIHAVVGPFISSSPQVLQTSPTALG